MESGLDGSSRQAGDGLNLFDAHAFEVAKDDDVPLLPPELCQGAKECPIFREGSGNICRRRLGLLSLPREPESSPFSLHTGQAAQAGHLDQEKGKFVLLLVARSLFPKPQKDVLNCVLGSTLISQESYGIGGDSRLMTEHDSSKGLGIAFLNSLHVFDITAHMPGAHRLAKQRYGGQGSVHSGT